MMNCAHWKSFLILSVNRRFAYCYRYSASHVGSQEVSYESAGSGSLHFLDKLLTVYKN